MLINASVASACPYVRTCGKVKTSKKKWKVTLLSGLQLYLPSYILSPGIHHESSIHLLALPLFAIGNIYGLRLAAVYDYYFEIYKKVGF